MTVPTSNFIPDSFQIRAMTAADIPAVLEIDALTAPTPWKEAGYKHELTENKLAHYFVLENEKMPSFPKDGIFKEIISFGGYWLVAGECHISTIATHPDWQRQGFGEALFYYMMQSAMNEEPFLAMLEVRQSNSAAQALYRKYKFEIAGRRKKYYKDTGEDALIMTVQPLGNAYQVFLDGMNAGILNY